MNANGVPSNAVIEPPARIGDRPSRFVRLGKEHPVVAFFAVTGICTVGLYLAYVTPVYLRLRKGDAFQVGPWNLGAGSGL